MTQKNGKQRLFEVMTKLDKTFKPLLTENYPMGAKYDSNAPWNERGSSPEYKGYEIKWFAQNPKDFYIRVSSEGHGYKDLEGFELVANSRDQEIQNYFEYLVLTQEIIDSPQFKQMVDRLFKETVNIDGIEWDEGDDGPDPDNYRDDMYETPQILEGKLGLEDMMAALKQKFNLRHIDTSEHFDGTPGGIWLSAENGETASDGRELFDYYSTDYNKYEFGVHNEFNKFAEDNGWYPEYYDGGTLMLWKN